MVYHAQISAANRRHGTSQLGVDDAIDKASPNTCFLLAARQPVAAFLPGAVRACHRGARCPTKNWNTASGRSGPGAARSTREGLAHSRLRDRARAGCHVFASAVPSVAPNFLLRLRCVHLHQPGHSQRGHRARRAGGADKGHRTRCRTASRANRATRTGSTGLRRPAGTPQGSRMVRAHGIAAASPRAATRFGSSS